MNSQEVKHLSNEEIAQKNFELLHQNSYPGRGIVVGRASELHAVIMYIVMSRSEPNRNRVLVYDKQKNEIKTDLADPTKHTGDTDLIIYPAMLRNQEKGIYVVSNGKQTTEAFKIVCSPNKNKATLADFMQITDYQYEPDSNSTPRITAVCHAGNGSAQFELSIMKKSRFSEFCDKQHFVYNYIEPGFGYCISTYAGDGKPLIPSFAGEPILLPIKGGKSLHTIAENYWEALNSANRVSLSAQLVNVRTGKSEGVKIINQYNKV